MSATNVGASIPVFVHGALGRMGRRVIDLAADTEGFEIIGGADTRAGDAPAAPGVTVTKHIPSDLPAGCVVIDFTLAGAVEELLEALGPQGHALVSGTTGLEESETDALRAYSEMAPVFYDSNMSYGISVMKRILAAAAPLMRRAFEAEIVEYHHSGKLDYPSGTAYGLAEAIDSEAQVVSGRGEGPVHHRPAIHVHSGRIGGLPGEHRVVFASGEEVITVEHRALTRDVFARGALLAARFVRVQPNGLYSMKDLLEAQHE